MIGKTILTILKIVLAIIAMFLAVTRRKIDKQVCIYWIFVFSYWAINALTDFVKF